MLTAHPWPLRLYRHQRNTLQLGPMRRCFVLPMSLMASFMNLAGPDLIVILLIILVLFGAKKLPELARGMGSAIREFQKAKDEFSDELHTAGKADAAKDTRTPSATVPRIENAPGADVRRDEQARTSDRPGQV